VVDLRACRVRLLATGVSAGARFSPDGRWLAYSRATGGSPAVVRVSGGTGRAPLGAGIVSWWWAPDGELLYGVDHHGRVLATPPGGPRRVVAAGASVTGAAGPSPDGHRLAVSASQCQPPRSELDTVDLATGARRVALIRPHAPATFAGWSPDGRWLLYWAQAQCSASLSADGWPLDAVSAAGGAPSTRAVHNVLLYPDFLTWCGHTLIAASSPSRETQLGSRLVTTGPPSWRQHTIDSGRQSWVSPTCAPSGRLLAAAAGPSTQNAGFGVQHRSIWLLTPTGRRRRRLTKPPAASLSDEAPRFSRDGRWILFVRSQVILTRTSSSSDDTLELVRATRTGAATPVPLVRFTSGDFSYYDHFAWPTEVDWSSP